MLRLYAGAAPASGRHEDIQVVEAPLQGATAFFQIANVGDLKKGGRFPVGWGHGAVVNITGSM